MNHKKAMPANGTRFSATTRALRRAGSDSQAPGLAVSEGCDRMMRTRARLNSTEKRIPATAAARGVRSPLPVSGLSGSKVRRPGLPRPRVRSPRSIIYRPASLAGVGGCRLSRQVDEGLPADVDDQALDRAAGESPGALTGIVVGDGLGS